MSGTISPYGTLAQIIANTTQVHGAMDTLTEQASSGLVAQSYAGLGATASIALNLSPQIAHLQTWQTAIDSAAGAMGVTQNALTQISSIASTFYADINDVDSVSSADTDNVATNARAALQQVATLLNSTYGANYVFAGTDTANPPVPSGGDISQSGFVSQIEAAVSGLATGNGATTFQTILGIGASNDAGTSPFSATLSQAAATVNAALPAVSVGEGEVQTTGIGASANAAVTSAGTDTTGSYMRDILVSLATIGAMSSAQTNNGSDLQGLVSATRNCLSGAITALNQDAGILGDTQSRLTSLQTSLPDTQTTLTSQLSDVQNVDMAKTLTALTQAQTQLQGSYQVIASLSSLNLSHYLTG